MNVVKIQMPHKVAKVIWSKHFHRKEDLVAKGNTYCVRSLLFAEADFIYLTYLGGGWWKLWTASCRSWENDHFEQTRRLIDMAKVYAARRAQK